MNSPLEQIFNNCALIVTPGANILNDGASFRWENSCVTSWQVHQHGHSQPVRLWQLQSPESSHMPGWRQWPSHTAATAQGSESTLNQFCGTEGGTEGIRQDHGGQYSQHRQGPHRLPKQCRVPSPPPWRDQVAVCCFSVSNTSQGSWLYEDFGTQLVRKHGYLCRTNLPRMVGCIQATAASTRWGHQALSLSHEWECCSWGKPQHPSNVPKCRAWSEVCGGLSGHDADNHYSLPVTAMGCSRSKSGISIPTFSRWLLSAGVFRLFEGWAHFICCSPSFFRTGQLW